MESESRIRLEALFDASRKRAPGPDRQAYLDGACGDDADLRSRVDALLAAHDEADGFLEGPAVQGTTEGPGSTIGAYRLLQQIGEGGMGVVYMAEQEKPVRRKVALKVIKLGMDTKQVIARFEAERQALAMMDHAHIARVLDAGATETGRPYFVMELVRGIPINQYCDTHKLATNERLGLFVEVCRAVQHAHQKGIIHRDLKPTNVLVSSHDGTPVPKIIDFGVAKATNQRLTERTLFTEFHQIIGTPEYMSPEQAEMSGLDVDTRSDIYSLGVLLYQLLTGTTPVDPTELRTAGFEEMTRMIREEEPQAPSTRISKLGAAGEQIAQRRNSDAGSLSRHFRGDLDWIVMKALEKDRTRRYATASAFAEDVVRHLEDLPVEAGPLGAGYRLRKFANRHRKVAAAAVVLVAVVGLGLAGTTAGFLRARAEADRNGRISASLQDVLAMTDSLGAADRQRVDSVLGTVRDVFGADHATFAAVLDTLSQRLHDAGDFNGSVELCREALEIWKTVYGDNHPNVAITLGHLGASLHTLGEEEEAENALREALAIFDAISGEAGLLGYEARIGLADLLGNRGEYAQADVLLREALEALRASPAPARSRILETLERRIALQINQPGGDARELLRELYEEANAFYPEDSPMLAIYALGRGRQLSEHGELKAAEPFLREAVERFRANPEAPTMSFFLAADTLFQVLRGRTDPQSAKEADELLGDMLRLGSGFLDADHLAATQRYYANRLLARGRFDDALDETLNAFQILVEAGRPADGRDSLRGDLVEYSFQLAFRQNGDPTLLARTRNTLELALLDERDGAAVRTALGAILQRQGEYELAVETLEPLPEALRQSRRYAKAIPVVHAFRALAHAHLGHESLAREALEALRDALEDSGTGPDSGALVSEIEALLQDTTSPEEGGQNP